MGYIRTCYHCHEENNEIYCELADDYKCPFNGKYHKMKHEIFGDKYILSGGDITGCEVYLAYNRGSDDARLNARLKKHETKIVFAVCEGDVEKFSELVNIFSSKEKAMQYLEDLSKFYNWKKPVVRTTDERFSNRTVVEIDTKTFVIIEHELL